MKNFHFCISSRPVLGPTPPSIQWVQGALSPGVKRQESEADHSPPTCAEVKITCSITSEQYLKHTAGSQMNRKTWDQILFHVAKQEF
jgi:hypothetical protein